MDDQLVLGIDAAWPQSLCATYFPYSHHLAESGHAFTVAQRVYQQRDGRRELTAVRIIEVVAGKWRAPIVKHAYEVAGRQQGGSLIFQDARNLRPHRRSR